MENMTPRNNPKRRRKTKAEIIKEAYLPTVFLIITFVLVAIFVIGAGIRNATKPSIYVPEQNPSESTSSALDLEAQQLMQDAALLALDYDFEAAATLLNTFSGDITSYPELMAMRNQYLQDAANMITWSDPSQITTLSFHHLIADPARAFADSRYGTSYNKNFVTVEEFRKILTQLYDNGYILVDLDDYTVCQENADGTVTCQAKPLQLPLGKKPLLLVQTNVNYYTYMVDSNQDGIADSGGAGFASCLVADANGKIQCSMVNANGTTVTGEYDLVPILNSFIEAHPDFSYRGARAILSVTGYDGIFGYRTDPATKEEKGDAYYQDQIAGAQKVVNALRQQGYRLACYTYNNAAYGKISAAEIQTDLRSWTAEVTPILGETNIMVFAQNSELTEYAGTKYNVLQNAGFRYYLGFTSGNGGGEVSANHILLKRLLVTGSQMAHSNVYSRLFDVSSVLDPQRGNVPN